jgi:hypothetical protein
MEKALQNGARQLCRFNVAHGSVFDAFWSCPAEAASRPRPYVTAAVLELNGFDSVVRPPIRQVLDCASPLALW